MNLTQPNCHPQLQGTTVVKNDVIGEYGIPQPMIAGFSSVRSQVTVRHPLEHSEKHVDEAATMRDYTMLRRIQGVAAPLHLEMERLVAHKSLRLPCLPSSNLASDVLAGRLDTIGYEEIFNDPMDAEKSGFPHMMIERRLGIL